MIEYENKTESDEIKWLNKTEVPDPQSFLIQEFRLPFQMFVKHTAPCVIHLNEIEPYYSYCSVVPEPTASVPPRNDRNTGF